MSELDVVLLQKSLFDRRKKSKLKYSTVQDSLSGKAGLPPDLADSAM